ncbi:MAG: hypothetical protein ACRDBP_16830 [Luteolibacter sp.]
MTDSYASRRCAKSVINSEFLNGARKDNCKTKSDVLRDLVLRLSSLPHIGDHFTVPRTVVAVFATQSQQVVLSDWMNPRL